LLKREGDKLEFLLKGEGGSSNTAEICTVLPERRRRRQESFLNGNVATGILPERGRGSWVSFLKGQEGNRNHS
jgi:hypothetical protein